MGAVSVRWGSVFAALAAAVAAVTSPAAAVEPAYGGRLLPAAETAAATVTGRIDGVGQVDRHGYAATLIVDRVLGGSAQPGTSLRIAWEEMAPSRPPRFRNGETVLVALDPLPGASLWQQRFPGGSGPPVLVVAAAGDAFLVKPDDATSAALAAFLALPAGERSGPAGVDVLARLVAGGNTAVSATAVQRLDGVPGLGTRVSPAAAADLARGLQRDVPNLQLGILRLAAQHRMTALRPAVLEAAQRGSSLEAPALVALAGLDGGLPRAQVESLLRRREAEVRAAGAYAARDRALEPRLVRLVRDDPDPSVRAAAAAAVLRLGGITALGAVASALADRQPTVRAATAHAAAGLGAAAVPSLLDLAQRQPRTAAAVVVALEGIGPEAMPALRRLAATHPDPAVRHLADLALGRAGEAH